ncbi:hypothetical protein HY992_01235 [Candidatus Micrarchaeota archaeon]|nr:hypothetical protein [Candidatus Micrarchaeota archaeon]
MKPFFFLALALLFFGCLQPAEPPSLSVQEFSSRLLSFQNASVFMNVTRASVAHSALIYNCGAELSGSIAGIGLEVSPYAIDGEKCFASGNRTLSTQQCIAEAPGYTFFIQTGANKTRFYNDYALLELPEGYKGKCSITSN